jgi:hypothetical protein
MIACRRARLAWIALLPAPAVFAHGVQITPAAPAQQLLRLVRIGHAAGRITWASGHHLRGKRLAAGLLVGFHHLLHSVASAAAQVERQQCGLLLLEVSQRRQVPLGPIHHMDEVAFTRAIRRGDAPGGVHLQATGMNVRQQLLQRRLGVAVGIDRP